MNAHWLCPPRPRNQTWAWENINLRKSMIQVQSTHSKLGSNLLFKNRELVPANSGVADEMCAHIPGLNIPAFKFPEWVIIQRQGSGCGRCWKAAFKGLHELSDGRLRCSHKDHALDSCKALYPRLIRQVGRLRRQALKSYPLLIKGIRSFQLLLSAVYMEGEFMKTPSTYLHTTSASSQLLVIGLLQWNT